MSSTELDRPSYFTNQFLGNVEGVDPDRRYTADELCDIYGFVDGALEDAPSNPNLLLQEMSQYAGLVDDFVGIVEHETLRYDFKGESGAPADIGKKIAGDRETRDSLGRSGQSSSSPVTKNPTPTNSRRGQPHFNADRYEPELEMDLFRREGQIQLFLDGEVTQVNEDSIELVGYEDLGLDDLQQEYDEFKEIEELDNCDWTVNNKVTSILKYNEELVD